MTKDKIIKELEAVISSVAFEFKLANEQKNHVTFAFIEIEDSLQAYKETLIYFENSPEIMSVTHQTIYNDIMQSPTYFINVMF